MALYAFRPVANGLRTDHPIPDLPFVDDIHIPIDDPAAIEAIGRHDGGDMWGRRDDCEPGGWLAFTTDPHNHDLAWVVRFHPEHGRTVVLYRDTDASGVHMVHVHEEPAALLFRAGGYWWDGATWYRPSQIWDGAAEEYYRRPVPAAVTVTAAALLQQGGDAEKTRVLKIGDLDAETAPPTQGRWIDQLARWASERSAPEQAAAVVTLAAPELNGDQLVGVAEMAEIAGIAASTLRAYISREENDVPLPQASLNGRSAWARPVAEEWAEQRRRSREGLTGAVAADYDDVPLAPGQADLWKRFTETFFSELWERPPIRKRWALRWRTAAAVRDLAKTLGWDVAGDLRSIVPVSDLAVTVRQAMLYEFAIGQEFHRTTSDPGDDNYQYFGIALPVAKMLDWLIRHEPFVAAHTIVEIIGEADRKLDIPRRVAERTITLALTDGSLDPEARREFLDRVLAPEANRD